MKLTAARLSSIVFILQILFAASVTSQTSTPPDSAKTRLINPADTTVTDTTLAPISPAGQESRIKLEDTGLEGTVDYSARLQQIDNLNNIIYLTGDAKVKYKEFVIEAGKITVKMNESTLIAETSPDTTLVDSTSQSGSSGGMPTFTDGKETMVGEKMEFNFKSEKGRILRGRTEYQKGYYVGGVVKRVDGRVFNVKDGIYSTCDKQEPHFHFRGKQMKVILNDKVLAKPVLIYIGKMPVMIAPFAMFSTKDNGRQSGIIIPQFGTSEIEGRYLRNLGYYWATNDYMDIRLTMDFFEKTGVLFRQHTNYALRYKFQGSVSASFTNKSYETRLERAWNLAARHNHTFNSSTTLNIDASFVSDNDFYKDFSNNRNNRLTRQLRSNATFSKGWADGRNRFSVNLSHTKDLEVGNQKLVLPQIRFSRNQSAIIPFKEDKRSRTKKEPKWYNYLRYSYGGFGVYSADTDSTNDPEAEIDMRLEHDINLNYTNPNKLFGWLSWNNRFSYNEDWYGQIFTYTLDSLTNRFERDAVSEFGTRRTFDYSASASTNMYGTFAPGIGPVTGLRHKMTPTLSFQYRPNFSDEFWGYYETREDTTGREVKLDRFRGTPRQKSLSLNYGLTNLFQMKLFEGEDEKKFDLFNLDFRGGYNFAADSLKWSNLTSSLRANPRRNVNVTLGMAHSFYAYNQQTGRTINELLSVDGGFMRLVNLQVDARWTLTGKSKTDTPSAGAETDNARDYAGVGVARSSEFRDELAPDKAFSAFDLPWRATLSFSVNLNRFNPMNPTKTAYLDLSNVEFQLTRNWRIGYRLRYDVVEQELVDQRFSFYRDLHCWEAHFNWSPSGISKGFYFKINIKAPHLQSAKYEHRGGSASVFSPY